MRKPRPAQGLMAALSSDQRTRLDVLLFEENKPYPEVVEILRSHFGVETSKGALSAYYQKRVRENEKRAIAEVGIAATVLGSSVEVTVVSQMPDEIILAIRPARPVQG